MAQQPRQARIRFLTYDLVNDLHETVVRFVSATESLAIRDDGLLRSALATPQQTWEGAYVYGSLAEMAAAYLIGLCQNHPYENGNKRIGFTACSTFLRMNGYQLVLSQDEAVQLTLDVVTHSRSREDVVSLIERAMRPLQDSPAPPIDASQPET